LAALFFRAFFFRDFFAMVAKTIGCTRPVVREGNDGSADVEPPSV
jgi:hypothetical protein